MGFSALYAERLHLPRMAAARQVMLWLLQSAPGVPSDAPLSFADLGAGTCAACLGARLALHEHAGAEQPFRAFAIDLATSSARFAKAFGTMCKRESTHGRPALLPGQSADQYLSSAEPGIGALASSLLKQIEGRSERQPHLILASFSLHYLKAEEKDNFYQLLCSLATRPLLLLVIKGLDQKGAAEVTRVVRSVHFGLHFVIGKDRNVRVVEAHLCLILPRAFQGAAPSGPAAARRCGGDARSSDQWVLQTFDAVERRVKADGLRTGVTLFEGSSH